MEPVREGDLGDQNENPEQIAREEEPLSKDVKRKESWEAIESEINPFECFDDSTAVAAPDHLHSSSSIMISNHASKEVSASDLNGVSDAHQGTMNTQEEEEDGIDFVNPFSMPFDDSGNGVDGQDGLQEKQGRLDEHREKNEQEIEPSEESDDCNGNGVDEQQHQASSDEEDLRGESVAVDRDVDVIMDDNGDKEDVGTSSSQSHDYQDNQETNGQHNESSKDWTDDDKVVECRSEADSEDNQKQEKHNLDNENKVNADENGEKEQVDTEVSAKVSFMPEYVQLARSLSQEMAKEEEERAGLRSSFRKRNSSSSSQKPKWKMTPLAEEQEQEQEQEPKPVEVTPVVAPADQVGVSSEERTGSATSALSLVQQDLPLNDALLQLQVLLMMQVSFMLQVQKWPAAVQAENDRMCEAFSEERLSCIAHMRRVDIETGVEHALSYVSTLVRDRPEFASVICRIVRRVRDQALLLENHVDEKRADNSANGTSDMPVRDSNGDGEAASPVTPSSKLAHSLGGILRKGIGSKRPRDQMESFRSKKGAQVEEYLFTVLSRLLRESSGPCDKIALPVHSIVKNSLDEEDEENPPQKAQDLEANHDEDGNVDLADVSDVIGWANIAFAHFEAHHKNSGNTNTSAGSTVANANVSASTQISVSGNYVSHQVAAQLIGFLSRFALEATISNFVPRINKVYFQASAMELIPFMRVCGSVISFSRRDARTARATKAFLEALVKLFKTTNYGPLIEQGLACIVYLMECLSIEHRFIDRATRQQDAVDLEGNDSTAAATTLTSATKVNEPDHGLKRRSSSSIQSITDEESDIGDELEQLFTITNQWVTKNLYVGSGLGAMEAIVAWGTESNEYLPTLGSQHDRLCMEIIKRLEKSKTRISGVDHLQRYLSALPLNILNLTRIKNEDGLGSSGGSSRSLTAASAKPSIAELSKLPALLAKVPQLLFPVKAVPRAQEGALISKVLAELGRRGFKDLFYESLKIGLESDSATIAQKAICLNALAVLCRIVDASSNRSSSIGIRDDETQRNSNEAQLAASVFRKCYSDAVARLAARDCPASVVAEAMACYPVLGEENREMLAYCVECAIGYDEALKEAGCEALLRFCRRGSIFAEKAITVVIESPHVRMGLISTFASQRPRTAHHVKSSLKILDMVLAAALASGEFQSEELVVEAGAALILAGTFPDDEVRVAARLALDNFSTLTSGKIPNESTGGGGNIVVPNHVSRAIDKIINQLMASSTTGEALCGSSQVIAIRDRMAQGQRLDDFTDPLDWWGAQCELVCKTKLGPSHSGKQRFVRALVQEFCGRSGQNSDTSKRQQQKQDQHVNTLILHALSQLDECIEAIDKQIALQGVASRDDAYNGQTILLLASLAHKYKETPLAPRVQSTVGTWIMSWNSDSDAKTRMRLWSHSELEASAELLTCYINNGELENKANFHPNSASNGTGASKADAGDRQESLGKSASAQEEKSELSQETDCAKRRDQVVLLIREWCRARERSSMKRSRVPDAFIALLASGCLYSPEAKMYALKMLSAFSSFKAFQSQGLGKLLEHNFSTMLGHYYETLMHSFDAERWAEEDERSGGTTITVPVNDRQGFTLHVAVALLKTLDREHQNIPKAMSVQLLVMVCLLFVHVLPEVRSFTCRWALSSQFLSLKGFNACFVSSKIGGVTKAIYLSEYVALAELCHPLEFLTTATKIAAQYLSDEQVAQLVLLLEPWLGAIVASTKETEAHGKRAIPLLLKLYSRVGQEHVVSWRVWRNPSLIKSLSQVVHALVNTMAELPPERMATGSRAPLTAIRQLGIGVMETRRQNQVDCNMLRSFVDALPPVAWSESYQRDQLQDKDEREARDKHRESIDSTSNALLGTASRKALVRSALSLMSHAPFLLRDNYLPADLSTVLYFALVEEGYESPYGCALLNSVCEELAPLENDGFGSKRKPIVLDATNPEYEKLGLIIKQEGEAVAFFFVLKCLDCVLFCSESKKRARAIAWLDQIGTKSMDSDAKAYVIDALSKRCADELNDLSKLGLDLVQLHEKGESNMGAGQQVTGTAFLSTRRVSRLSQLMRALALIASSLTNEELQANDTGGLVASLAACVFAIPQISISDPLKQVRYYALEALMVCADYLHCDSTDAAYAAALGTLLLSPESSLSSARVLLALPLPAEHSANAEQIGEASHHHLWSLSPSVLPFLPSQSSAILLSAAIAAAAGNVSLADKLTEMVLSEASCSGSADEANNHRTRIIVADLKSAWKNEGDSSQAILVSFARNWLRVSPAPSPPQVYSILGLVASIIAIGSDRRWCFEAVRLIGELVKHNEVVSMCTGQSKIVTLLVQAIEGVLERLSSGDEQDENARSLALQVMASLPLKTWSSARLEFMQSRGENALEQSKIIFSGIAESHATLALLLYPSSL